MTGIRGIGAFLSAYKLPKIENAALKNHYSNKWRVLWHNNRQYLANSRSITILEVDSTKKCLIPVVYSYLSGLRYRVKEQPETIKQKISRDKKFSYESCIWNDLDQNQQLQNNEITFYKRGLSGASHCFVSQNFDYTKIFYSKNKISPLESILIKAERWINNVPIYQPFDTAQVTPLELDDSLKKSGWFSYDNKSLW